jgi:hypothetical protein
MRNVILPLSEHLDCVMLIDTLYLGSFSLQVYVKCMNFQSKCDTGACPLPVLESGDG